MTDRHRFAMSAERWQGELWNVTLLPIEQGWGPVSNETTEASDASLLENLDEKRTREHESAQNGASRLRHDSESISASFEGQLKAVGW